ncbi:alkaline phosphatase family protein [Candidatus Woesearchaeota archaeon]|nr:alkaline phosphatase family protein [Candidatus Woesearchaeota archaeon]
MSNKINVIGLDGATFYLLDKIVARGLTPNIHRIMTQGYKNVCTSIYPPLSPPAWATIATGVNPAKHGVFDFFYMPFRREGSYARRIVNTTQWKIDTVFHHFNKAGYSCGVINYPMGYPPLIVNKYFISGLGTPGLDTDYTYPLDLKKEIAQQFPDYLIDVGGGIGQTSEAFLQSCRQMMLEQIKAAKYLFDKYPVDMFYAVFAFTDRFQHWFWQFIDPQSPSYGTWKKPIEVYEEFFKEVDAFFGLLLERMHADDVLLVLSDHGFGPIKKYFYINKFLYEAGLLHFLPEAKIFHQKNTPDGLLTSIDWTKTVAYSLGDYGEIRINLKGREPKGIVQPGEEYHRLRLFIKNILENVVDPEDGKKITDTVFLKEEVYNGPMLHEAPDLLFTLRHCSYLCYINGRGNEFYNYDKVLFRPPSKNEMEQWTGGHTLDGIFMAYGKTVNKDAVIPKITLYDIPATLLFLKGIPLPQSLDGKALQELFINHP